MPPSSKEEAIISFLSNGKKQRKEIIKYIAVIEESDYDEVESSVANKLSKLVKHGEIKKKSEGVYYIPDQGGQIVRPKPEADHDEVNNILSNLESSLELESHNSDTPTSDRITQPELLDKLSNIVLYKKNLLYNDESIRKFANIFDLYTQRLVEQTGINEDAVAKTDTIIEYQLLFQITSDLITNAQNGQGNSRISTEIYPHIQTISEHIRDLPPALGIEIQALARTIHVDRGQELFTELVKNDSYEEDVLLEMAFYTYDVHHEVDKLFNHLEKAKAETNIGMEKSQIRSFKQTLANLYQNGSTQSS